MHWSWSRVADAAIVVGVLAAGLVEVIAPTSSRQGEGDVTVSAIQVVVVALALWWRRTRPLATVAVVLGGLWVPDVLAVSGLTGPAYVLFYGGLVPILVATFSVARHGRGRTPYVGAALAAATLLYVDLFVELLQGTGEIVFHWSVLTIAWAFGSWQRVMARRAEDSLRRAVEVEVAAAEQARTAVLEERARIARELHDIVAHAMSVMVVQAGAAEQVVGDDPDRAGEALRQIRRTGTEALAEMRRLVSVLREPGDHSQLAPQPGLAGLEALVEDARASGLPVALSVSGAERDLPAGLDLAAYRIVQEALTNVRRHASSASCVSVAVHFGHEDLRIDVTDDGPGAAEPAGTGHGLTGMRERAQLYGGRLHAVARPGAGFQVSAELPLAGP